MFASEPAALVQAGVPARANLQVAAQYLALGLSDQGRDGFFQNIQQLEPGQTVRVGADAVLRSVDTPTATANGSVASFAEFAASLETSVRLHLRSDVPVGTCLSGGLDSSTLAALASKMVRAAGGPRFAAVTAGSADTRTDERPFAAEVVRHCDLVWEVVIPSAAEFTSEIETCLRVQGEPVGGPSVYFQYCVMRAARAAGLKVMLDGQGADELLCGYERYVPTWGLEIAGKQGPWAALRGVVRLAHNYRFGVRGMFALAAYVTLPPLRRYLIGRRTAFLRAEFSPSIVEVVTRIASASRHLHSARIADIAHFSLPALLRYEDRNSMAHSIEARVPYVDKEVVACALRLSDTELLQEGFTKYPLRTVAASILPASIAWRRFKIGFEPPTQTWLAVLKDRMQTEIDASPLIARLVHVVPRMHQLPLAMQWRLYNLACWQRLFAVGVD
jgi:asparagine synthase (glutamine-hydrolysing)